MLRRLNNYYKKGEGETWVRKHTRRGRDELDQVLWGLWNRTALMKISKKNGNRQLCEVGGEKTLGYIRDLGGERLPGLKGSDLRWNALQLGKGTCRVLPAVLFCMCIGGLIWAGEFCIFEGSEFQTSWLNSLNETVGLPRGMPLFLTFLNFVNSTTSVRCSSPLVGCKYLQLNPSPASS